MAAEARDTLRTRADARHSPSRTSRAVNARLLASTDDERHCALVCAALGLPEDAELHDSTTSRAGRPALPFSDGLIGPRHGTEMFGDERTHAMLVQHRDTDTEVIATALVNAARQFHGPHLDDGLALLLLRVHATQPHVE